MEKRDFRRYTAATLLVAVVFFLAADSAYAYYANPIDRFLNSVISFLYSLPPGLKLVLIIVGLLSLLAGSILYKYMIMLPGAVIGLIVGFALGRANGEFMGILMALVGIFAGGAIAWFLHQLVIWLVGAMIGVIFTVVISAAVFHTAPNIIIVIIAAIAGGGALLALATAYTIVLTVMIGSLLIMIGTGQPLNGLMLIVLTGVGVAAQYGVVSFLVSRGIVKAPQGSGATASSAQSVQLPRFAMAKVPDSVQLGKPSKRFLAFLFDSAVFSAAVYVVIRVFSILTGRSGYEVTFGYQVFVIFAAWIYYATAESSAWQATPGKLTLHLAVVDTTGSRISFGRASGRHFGKIISWLPLGAGYLPAVFSSTRQALHDIFASCLISHKSPPVAQEAAERQERAITGILCGVTAAITLVFPFSYLVGREVLIRSEQVFANVVPVLAGAWIHTAAAAVLGYCSYRFTRNRTVAPPVLWVATAWLVLAAAGYGLRFLVILGPLLAHYAEPFALVRLQYGFLPLAVAGLTLYSLISQRVKLFQAVAWSMPSFLIIRNGKTTAIVAAAVAFGIAAVFVVLAMYRNRPMAEFTLDALGDGTRVTVAQKVTKKNDREFSMQFVFTGKNGTATHRDTCYSAMGDQSECKARVIKLGQAEALTYWPEISATGKESNSILLYDPAENSVHQISFLAKSKSLEPFSIGENRYVIPLANDAGVLPSYLSLRPFLYSGYVVEYSNIGLQVSKLPAFTESGFRPDWCLHLYDRQVSEIQASLQLLDKESFEPSQKMAWAEAIQKLNGRVQEQCSAIRAAQASPPVAAFDEAEAQRFAEDWLSASQENSHFDAVMQMYADDVEFYKQGRISRRLIEEDKRKYFDRWPVRTYSLTTPVTVAAGDGPSEKRLSMGFSFTVKNKAKTISGKATNEITVRKVNDRIYIVSEKGETSR